MKTLIFALLLSQVSFAANSFDYIIQYGEKTTHYRLSESNDKILFKSSSDETDRKIEVGQDNSQFLLEKIQAIAKLKSNEISYCPNRFMKIEYKISDKTETRLGCINSPNPMAQKLTALANLLGFL
jgi:hypothetical protein